MKYLITLNLILTALAVGIVVFDRRIDYRADFESVGTNLKASWYGLESCVNPDCLMSNGEVFDENEISCASRTHYGKIVTIEYQGKTIECPVNDKQSVNYMDRIDLSKRAFETLADLDEGLISVVIR